MSRISATTLGNAIINNKDLKLVVHGSSVTRGRVRQMLRVRPTVLKRIKKISTGPIYLIIEHALEQLAERLEAMDPKERPIFIDGSTMDPTEEDEALEAELSKPKRSGRKAAKKD